MESNKLSNIHFVTSIADVCKIQLPETVYFSYYYNLNTPEAWNEFYHIFSNKTKQKFTVTLHIKRVLEGAHDWSWLGNLCLILCHPFYFSYIDKPIVLIHGTISQNYIERNFLPKLRDELTKQGFHDLILLNLKAKEHDAKNVFPHLIYCKDFTQEKFIQLFNERISMSDSALNIFDFLRENEELGKLESLQQMAEKEFIAMHPLAFKFLMKLKQRTSDFHQLKLLNKSLEEEVSSKKKYLDFLLDKFKRADNGEDINFNEIMKIKRFYHNEYEILPLWYKRFGHLIKVFMGKRSFRSLFDDNVKKYKD